MNLNLHYLRLLLLSSPNNFLDEQFLKCLLFIVAIPCNSRGSLRFTNYLNTRLHNFKLNCFWEKHLKQALMTVTLVPYSPYMYPLGSLNIVCIVRFILESKPKCDINLTVTTASIYSWCLQTLIHKSKWKGYIWNSTFSIP